MQESYEGKQLEQAQKGAYGCERHKYTVWLNGDLVHHQIDVELVAQEVCLREGDRHSVKDRYIAVDGETALEFVNNSQHRERASPNVIGHFEFSHRCRDGID